MRMARTLAVGTAATLMLGAGLAAADPGDPNNSQTITITVEEAPLELEVNGGTVEFTVTAGVSIDEADAIDPDSGSSSTITFKNPLGSAVEDAKLSVTRGTPDGTTLADLGEGDRDLTLTVSLDLAAVAAAVDSGSPPDLSGKGGPASWTGTGTETRELITGGLARGTDADGLTLTWKLHGDTGTTPDVTLNAGTFIFVIAEADPGS